ncbi:hypothetical protein [Nitratireductor basaltis]|uniref:Uncharacterized protein n=1 Tax=Nitratireductor basaltis TaxID=472175 RepID=A0A084UBH9_9HYPH|nr:hypothetical protein [Nitratireductor basaltis]KFB10315.1 hypothetical protein EL18_01346 [Nitratireductor basaltis]
MPVLASRFFKIAIVFLILGIGMGLQMAMSGNHNVIGPHAHTNLLGWVTSALFGTYYALNPAKAQTRLAGAHFWLWVVGLVLLTPALYLLYLGYAAIEPVTAIASLTLLAAALVFAAVLFRSESASVPAAMRPAE